MRRIAVAFAVVVLIIQAGAAEPVFMAEAEDLEVVGATDETKYAEDASGGDYVFLLHQQKDPEDVDAGYIRFTFDCEPGDYVLRARCLSTSKGSDSFWFFKGDGPAVRVSPYPTATTRVTSIADRYKATRSPKNR